MILFLTSKIVYAISAPSLEEQIRSLVNFTLSTSVASNVSWSQCVQFCWFFVSYLASFKLRRTFHVLL